jgi:hypothetical protein
LYINPFPPELHLTLVNVYFFITNACINQQIFKVTISFLVIQSLFITNTTLILTICYNIFQGRLFIVCQGRIPEYSGRNNSHIFFEKFGGFQKRAKRKPRSAQPNWQKLISFHKLAPQPANAPASAAARSRRPLHAVVSHHAYGPSP